ncbi:MAG: hypothetical protein SNF33_04475 [Candidatus Algichlamydia australiensis]|nr:hypothetical protein [Chlamydiales bacterium]
MKKFGTLFLLAFVGVFSTANANETEYASDSFVYGSLGTEMPGNLLPVFGLGFRGQSGHNGFDMHAQGAAYGETQMVKGALSYLYYFQPNLQGQFYAGLGASVKQIFDRTKTLSTEEKYRGVNGNGERYHKWIRERHDVLSVAPELTLGKQYISNGGGRRFFQAQITPFVVSKSNDAFKTPENGDEKTPFFKGTTRSWTPSVTLSYGWGF